MTGRDIELTAAIDDSQVLKSLQGIEKNIENMAKRANTAFAHLQQSITKTGIVWDKTSQRFRDLDTGKFVSAANAVQRIGDSGQKSAQQMDALLDVVRRIDASTKKLADSLDRVEEEAEDVDDALGKGTGAAKFGAIAGIAQEVTRRLIEAGEAAIRFGINAVKASTEAALGLETTEASLIGIFEGNEAAALASLDRIKQASLRLGVDLTALAPAFLPRLESLEQFERVGELAAGLARIDPAQGALGARIALQEALSGDPLTLRRRFEIDIRPIQKAQEELGDVEGLLVGLEEVLATRGQDFESLGDTAAARLGIAQEAINQLQTTLGEPILDQVKEELNEFIDLVTVELPDGTRKIKDEFVLIAGAVGDVVAKIGDIAGDLLAGFTDDLDTEKILDFVTLLGESVSLTAALGETMAQLDFVSFNTGFEGINKELEDFNKLLETANKATAIFRLSQLAKDPETLGALFKAGQEEGFSLETFVQTIDEASAGGLSETFGILGEAEERVNDLADATEERRKKLEESNDADLDAAENILATNRAQQDAAADAAEYAEAQEKLNKAFAEFDTDKARAEADLFLKQQRDLLDFEIKASQEREKIARKNLQDIAKIHRKHSDDIAKAAVDLGRDEEKIARDGARAQVDLEKDIAKERIRAEENFQNEIQRIKARFEFDAQEAIRANDAIAFLAAQRRRDFEIEQAREGKDEQINEAEQTAIERREALQSQLQQEIEDAQIANARKLEDLRTSLQISLREQQIKYQQEVQEQAIAEQQKREALKKTQQEQIQDFNTYWQRRLEDLNRNYQKEIEITKRYEAQLAAIRAASARSLYRGRFAQTAALGGDITEAQGARPGASGLVEVTVPRQAISTKEFDDPNFDSAGSFGETVRRHGGGRVVGGHDYIIGRPGAEERFRPDVSGTVSPMPSAVMFNPVTAGQASSVTNNINRTTNLNIEAMLNSLSPQQLAVVTQLVHQLNMSYIG